MNTSAAPRKTVRMWFSDFWKGFDPDKSFLTGLIRKRYDVVLDPVDPQWVIYSDHGNDFLKYTRCIRIYYTAENLVPNFNLCDYGIGFYYLDFGERYMRFPLYPSYGGLDKAMDKTALLAREGLAGRKFCNYIYSNSLRVSPEREEIFHRLSRYKPVDSGGKSLNNLGYRVGDKIRFLEDYKFTIAFENSSIAGYRTEKIFEPMLAGSIPIYWGDPRIDEDFNPDAFVWVRPGQTFDDAIDEVIALDSDPRLYMEKLARPWFRRDPRHYVDELLDFFGHIIENGTRQRPRYGWGMIYEKRLYPFKSRIIRSRDVCRDKLKSASTPSKPDNR